MSKAQGSTEFKMKNFTLNKCIDLPTAEMQIASLTITTATSRATPSKIEFLYKFPTICASFWICPGCSKTSLRRNM